MSKFLIAVAAVIVVAFVFFMGLANAWPVPMMCGFLLWTPAILFLGWCASSAARGRRLRVTFTPEQVAYIRQADEDRKRINRLDREVLFDELDKVDNPKTRDDGTHRVPMSRTREERA